jgi:hypothetical protein
VSEVFNTDYTMMRKTEEIGYGVSSDGNIPNSGQRLILAEEQVPFSKRDTPLSKRLEEEFKRSSN